MSWATIAKKDFQDSIRSRGLWVIIGLFLLLIGSLAYLASDGNISSTEALLSAMAGTFLIGILLFVPLTGLFISIKSIVRERESGTINLLLSLPHTRGEMVVGQFLGRSAVLTIAIIIGFLPASLLFIVQADITPLYEVFVLILSTVLFGLMFVAVGVGFSAMVSSETQAAIGGIAIFILLYAWPIILELLDVSVPDFVERFWLFTMFWDMMATFLSFRDSDIPTASIVAYDAGNPAQAGGIPTPEFYLQHWFVFFILALWIVVPLAVGYLRFNSVDL